MKFTIPTLVFSTLLILSTIFVFAIPVGERSDAVDSLTENHAFKQVAGLHIPRHDSSGSTFVNHSGQAEETYRPIDTESLPEVFSGTRYKGSGLSIAGAGHIEERGLVEVAKHPNYSGGSLASIGKTERSAEDTTPPNYLLCDPPKHYRHVHPKSGQCTTVHKRSVETCADDVSINTSHAPNKIPPSRLCPIGHSINTNYAHNNSPPEKRGSLPPCNPQEHPKLGTCLPAKKRSYRDRLPPCDPKRHGPNPKPGWCTPINAIGEQRVKTRSDGSLVIP